MKKVILAMISILFLLTYLPAYAGTLQELEEGLYHYVDLGEVSDPDVKATLYDLITQAKGAADTESENAYRSSFIDVVNAFNGSGISSEAAAHLVSLAQPAP